MCYLVVLYQSRSVFCELWLVKTLISYLKKKNRLKSLFSNFRFMSGPPQCVDYHVSLKIVDWIEFRLVLTNLRFTFCFVRVRLSETAATEIRSQKYLAYFIILIELKKTNVSNRIVFSILHLQYSNYLIFLIEHLSSSWKLRHRDLFMYEFLSRNAFKEINYQQWDPECG